MERTGTETGVILVQALQQQKSLDRRSLSHLLQQSGYLFPPQEAFLTSLSQGSGPEGCVPPCLSVWAVTEVRPSHDQAFLNGAGFAKGVAGSGAGSKD